MKVLAPLMGLLLFAVAPLAHAAPCDERTVSIPLDGVTIAGTLCVPEAGASSTVLILHGTSGDRAGPRIRGDGRGLFQRAAERLAEKGMASLAISTRGRGGSGGDFRDMTLTRRVDEAEAAIEWLQAEGLGIGGLSVVGHSQGSAVATLLAARLETRAPLAALVLWAPLTDPLAQYRRAMGPATFAKGLAAGPGDVVSWKGAGGTPRGFHADFFKDLQKVDVPDAFARFSGPALVVTGERDRWATTASTQMLKSARPTGVTYSERSVGHRMGAGAGLAAADDVIGATAAWLADNARPR